MPDIHSINPWIMAHKDALTILIGAIAAGFGLYNYIKNVQTKRAEFIYKLHTDFFVSATYKKVRSVLDSEDKSAQALYVTQEPEEFTDFLNSLNLLLTSKSAETFPCRTF
jgi:hypothetical protein